MNNLKSVFLIILLLYSCQTSQTLIRDNSDLLNNKENPIFIYQNGKEQVIKKRTEAIKLEKKSFSIRCYNKAIDLGEYNATQIAVFLTDYEFKNIRTGLATKNIPCFSPGTGYAMYGDGSDKYFLFETDPNRPGHHYLYYENTASRRLNLIEDFGSLLKLEFEVNEFHVRGPDNKITETPIPKTDIDKFFLAILMDHNLNDTIDFGELHKLTISFK
jgi:hypothetical protein